MSTVLVFVIIPVVVIVVVASLTLAGNSSGTRSRRYRPGRPYDFQPIWFLSAPTQLSAPYAVLGHAEARPAAIEAGVIEDSSGQRVLPGPVGGASDRW